MDLIYPPFAYSGINYDFFGLPIEWCKKHAGIPFKDTEWCMDCKKIRERVNALYELKKEQRKYEKQRKERNKFLNRLYCLFHAGHTYELIGILCADLEANAGSWGVDIETRIKDCKYCGKRKLENY